MDTNVQNGQKENENNSNVVKKRGNINNLVEYVVIVNGHNGQKEIYKVFSAKQFAKIMRYIYNLCLVSEWHYRIYFNQECTIVKLYRNGQRGYKNIDYIEIISNLENNKQFEKHE